jgi:hypothetical protein
VAHDPAEGSGAAGARGRLMGSEAGDGVLVLGQGDGVLVIDVFNSFEHDDGDALLDSFRERTPRMERAIDLARGGGIPLVYVNDAHGGWDSDVQALLRETLPQRAASSSSPSFRTPASRCCSSTAARPSTTRRSTSSWSSSASPASCSSVPRPRGASSCATTDPELEAVALRYAEDVVGVRLERVARDA